MLDVVVVDFIDKRISPFEQTRCLNMKLMCHEDRMDVFAPASESVVGNHSVDVVIFDDAFNFAMFFLEIGICTW